MSETWVTSTGFRKKTLVEIKGELEAAFQQTFGANIDLSASGPFGQLIGLLSQREADLWDGAQEIYDSRDLNVATGTSLDKLSAELGLRRIDASPTIIVGALLYGDPSTLVSAGKLARQTTTAAEFALQSDVTISTANAGLATLEPSGNDGTYTVTIAGTAYSYVASSKTPAQICDALKALIDADWTGITTSAGGLLTVYSTASFSLSYTSNLSLEELASHGEFRARIFGPTPAPAFSLDTIVTPVSGWRAVSNPESGSVGRSTESDADFRLRISASYLVGNATEDAIRQNLLNRVEGITAASVTSNRTLDNPDTNGLPAKSYEAVVEGGDNQDIGEVLWDTQPAGIASHGDITVDVSDSEGFPQQVKFSRPTPRYIWVKVQRDLNSEETYPADGDAQIAAAVAAWGADFQLGEDVIRQRITVPVYTVPGIGDLNITIAATAGPSDTPSYAASNIAVARKERALFAAARVVVEDLP